MTFRQSKTGRAGTTRNSSKKLGQSARYRRLKIESLENRTLLHGSFDLDDFEHTAGCACGCCGGIHGFVTPTDGADGGEVEAAGALHALTEIPVLNSNAGAAASIYLDFDGHFESNWGSYSNITTPVYDIDGDDTTFSDAELSRIHDIWTRVAEDFAPFDINVTTVNPGDFSNGTALRVSIGGNGSWIGSYGGVAYVNSFTNAVVNTAYVFTDNLANGAVKYTAEAISHEAGHAFGLRHQSDYDANGNKTAEYSNGDSANGGWAPIMGVGYYQARTTWHNGANSLGSTSFQDDMSVLARSANGFGYRTDDHANSYISSTALSGTSFTDTGIIEQMSDVDYFSFSTGAGQITLSIELEAGITNLDSVLELRSANGTLIATIDPSGTFESTYTGTVAAGDYHLVVRSTGEYGSVGQYTVSGEVQAPPNNYVNNNSSNSDYALANGVLTVNGTNGDDLLEFFAGSTYRIVINGNTYNFQANDVSSIQFDGLSGNDRVVLTGSSAKEILRTQADAVSFEGIGFLLQASDVEDIVAYGGIEDYAFFYDTAGDEFLLAKPLWVRMTGSGFSNLADGFGTTVAYSSGGNDMAMMYDSAGIDAFLARPQYAFMRGSGFQNYASGFNDVRAYSTAGGLDRAFLYDSAGNDTFFGRPDYTYLRGSDFFSYATGFSRVYGYAINGGTDRAFMYDSAGNDIFVGRGTAGYLYGSGFFNLASGFDLVYAYAISGGTDAVSMLDTAGNDTFLGRSNDTYMSGTGYFNYARGFDRVYANAAYGGIDRAVMYDSIGNDSFVGTSTYATMIGNGFYNYVRGFERVDVLATAGGHDVARFYDSSENDTFYGQGDFGSMKGSSYYNNVRGFDRLDIFGNAGGVNRLNVSAVNYLFANYGMWN